MTYVINSLKSQRKLPLAPVFERADIVHKNEGNRACDVIPRLCKGGGDMWRRSQDGGSPLHDEILEAG